MAGAPHPSRGEVWLVDLDPTLGHEQGGKRPALVISADGFNHSGAGLVAILPLTTKEKKNPSHVSVSPPEGGLRQNGFVKCEDIRCASKQRLSSRWGNVSPRTLAQVSDRVRMLLGL